MSDTQSPVIRPAAALLDFGGVVVTTQKRPTGPADLAREMSEALQAAGFGLTAERLEDSLQAGLTALKLWKNAASRRRFPRDLGHRELIVDFLAADLPVGPREFLASEAVHWLSRKNVLVNDHFVRPGIPEFLETCKEQGIGLGIVSNAQSGHSHRQILDEFGLGEYFGVQVYSDEVGIRKPNPQIITMAAQALGVGNSQCWYVGDTFDRDVVAGRRAGAGAVIITRDSRTANPPFAIAEQPDAILDDPTGLLDLLETATPAPAPEQPEVPTFRTPGALLIDHGGVISRSRKNAETRNEFVEEMAGWLGVDKHTSERILVRALDAAKLRKKTNIEATAAEFWAAGVQGEDPRVAALVQSEACALAARWGRAKSTRTMREGIPELFALCRDAGYPVVVVTNTVSGVAVRSYLHEYGLDELVTAVIASDEIGVRKPAPGITEAALAVSGSDPGTTWFLGDKPENDAAGALACGIAHRVLVRLDPPTAEQSAKVDQALAEGLATHVIDSPAELVDLMRRHIDS
ncbi:hypothetical protein AYJ05_11480 [Corynebacterium stationis]|uniref:HAD family hydrolase n=1 Tax=Corynebacterium stationis TaxID=1705 RepID=A0A177IP57_9CORY|nr:HAD family hydrolase [Corynebacterium stationis]OAH29775.1 hypothetical protein AYJ05_11480 [Corynebacterium stationis]